MKKQNFNKGEIIIYKSQRGPEIQAKLVKDTVWLDAHQMSRLFDVNRPTVVKHINNIYKTVELDKELTCSILEQVAADGKIRKMNFYNLDVIISVGYRVNSKNATKFRIWATNTLKEHLIKGYSINRKRLLQSRNRLKELQVAIDFLLVSAKNKLLVGQEHEMLNLLANYSKTLKILEQYDKEKLPIVKKTKSKYILKYNDASKVIYEIKKGLIDRNEASDLFGQEPSDRFKAILGNIYQTFDGKELYSSLEEKAAHLLYLTIKDHPFVDGNKRIASFLFIYFLDKNNYLYREIGEKKLNDNALTALSLLIAVSKPKEKDILIKIITNLMSDENDINYYNI